MAWRCYGFKSHQLHWLWVQIPPAAINLPDFFCYFLGTFGCDTGMKLPDHIKPMTGFQIGNSMLLPEGPAGLGPAQKMRKTRPWLLSDVNRFFFLRARSFIAKQGVLLVKISCICYGPCEKPGQCFRTPTHCGYFRPFSLA